MVSLQPLPLNERNFRCSVPNRDSILSKKLIAYLDKIEAPLGTGLRKFRLFKGKGSNQNDFLHQIRATSTDL